MPDTRQTLSRTQHGDYRQWTAIDCEEGSLRVTIEGPAGVIQIDVETPDDLAPQLRQLDQLVQAVAAARAVLASLLGDDPRRRPAMGMTIAELLADLEAQLEDGVDPKTPVLIAVQPHWPLVHELAGVAAVYVGEDRAAPCTHLLLAVGGQRNWPTPYTTEVEDAVLEEMNWRE